MPSERNSSGPLPVSGKPAPSSDDLGSVTSPAGLPRSPPKNKNTAHVPCKFFLQGQCQAGRMCPFSHDLESTTRPAPCKYFAKGGCKFGRKCALLHVAPDGTVVNRMPAPSFAPPTQNYLPQAQSAAGIYAPTIPGLLSMQAQALDPRRNGEMVGDYDVYNNAGARNGLEQPHIDYTSASPKYGSPAQEFRFGASPPQRGLSVLDAPLPNSFDSNGISLAARNGPFAASVPSRFGLESPPASMPRKSQFGNLALRDLHNSAFGDVGMDGMIAGMGSSPPSGTDEPLTFPKRSLHSDRLRAPRAIYSASLGTRIPTQTYDYSDDDDGDTDREEDLLPASLRDLIPEGRSRRESRSRPEDDSPAAHLAAQRRTISGHGTPQDSKVGSPHSSSPSRFTGMFAARAQAGKTEVGSPLRNSGFSYAQAIASPPSTSTRPINTGELSPSISSPPRQASMSMLTQELQRTKLDAARAAAAHPTPLSPSATASSSRNTAVAVPNTQRYSLDRALSSTSVGKIDEEQELFDMDEVGDRPTRATPRFTSSDSLQLSTSPWNARPFGVSVSSSPSNTRNSSSELLSFGAIGSQRK